MGAEGQGSVSSYFVSSWLSMSGLGPLAEGIAQPRKHETECHHRLAPHSRDPVLSWPHSPSAPPFSSVLSTRRWQAQAQAALVEFASSAAVDTFRIRTLRVLVSLWLISPCPAVSCLSCLRGSVSVHPCLSVVHCPLRGSSSLRGKSDESSSSITAAFTLTSRAGSRPRRPLVADDVVLKLLAG
jgi:hypothetical protein